VREAPESPVGLDAGGAPSGGPPAPLPRRSCRPPRSTSGITVGL
jgi:hypothetical protein